MDTTRRRTTGRVRRTGRMRGARCLRRAGRIGRTRTLRSTRTLGTERRHHLRRDVPTGRRTGPRRGRRRRTPRPRARRPPATALGDITPGAVAGHSVGEITAAAFAGVLDDSAALALVRKRGLAMAEAAAITETGMSALLGGDPDVSVAHLEKLGLTPANVNGAGQIVAAGTLEQLAVLAEDKPEGVRKVVPLKVAGAFHTHHMAPAVDALAKAAADLVPGDPKLPYVSNKDGRTVATGAEILQRLVGQVANPVRWDLCMETFKELGVTAFVEVCPGGTLTGLAKRALPGVKTLALKTPDDLDAARELITEHANA
ncbi:ACP S-malonyltransferase [Streptomyces sp. NPDC001002]